jgi:hypothetical protein
MMRTTFIIIVLASVIPVVGKAQQRDTTARRDSIARADSVARADSIRLVRELERIRGEARPPQVIGEMGPTPAPQPANPSLIPNISAIADVVADLSADGSTLESGRRFDIREVELALGANVDPFFRGDFILGLSDEEGIAIEEAYVTTTALPWQLQVKGGRFHLPFGKQNTTHRAELHTIEYPHVVQRFLGAEGGKGTGAWLSKIFAPFGFYQELQLTAIESFPEGHEEEEAPFEAVATESPNENLSGLGFTGRLRNYWDVSEASNVELSFSAGTGRRTEPFGCVDVTDEIVPCPGPDGETGVNARQSIFGADVTFRWRPLQQGLYKSFILQAEVMRQQSETPALPAGVPPSAIYLGPTEDLAGAYVFARWQLTRRVFLGGRYDWIEAESGADRDFAAASGYLQIFPSEFSKIMLGFEHLRPEGGDNVNRLLVQTTIAIGPHRPHPF